MYVLQASATSATLANRVRLAHSRQQLELGSVHSTVSASAAALQEAQAITAHATLDTQDSFAPPVLLPSSRTQSALLLVQTVPPTALHCKRAVAQQLIAYVH